MNVFKYYMIHKIIYSSNYEQSGHFRVLPLFIPLCCKIV